MYLKQFEVLSIMDNSTPSTSTIMSPPKKRSIDLGHLSSNEKQCILNLYKQQLRDEPDKKINMIVFEISKTLGNMFFDLVLLKPQHKGAFGFAWIAATRGVKHIKEKELLNIEVDKVCVSIMEFLTSESYYPNRRFSLRLSVMLINGVIKIFRQQTVLLQNDIFAITSQTTSRGISPVPRLEESVGVFSTPTTPIHKTKPKKKPKTVQPVTPVFHISDLERQAKQALEIETMPDVAGGIKMPRAEAVTLQEKIPHPELVAGGIHFEILEEIPDYSKHRDMDPAIRDILEPTVQPTEETHFIQTGQHISSATLSPANMGELKKEATFIPIQPRETSEQLRTRRRESESSPSEPQEPIVLQVQVQVHAPYEVAEHVVPQTEETLPKEPDQLLITPRRVSPPIQEVPEDLHPVVPSRENETDVQKVPDRHSESSPPKRKKAQADKMSKFFLDMHPRRVVCIDRCADGQMELFKPKEIIPIRGKLKESTAKSLWLCLLSETDINVDDVDERLGSKALSSIRETLSFRRTTASIGTPPVEATKTSSGISLALPVPTQVQDIQAASDGAWQSPIHVSPALPTEVEMPLETLDVLVQEQDPLMSSTPVSTRKIIEDIPVQQKTIETVVARPGKEPARLTKRKVQLIEEDVVTAKDVKKPRTERHAVQQSVQPPEILITAEPEGEVTDVPAQFVEFEAPSIIPTEEPVDIPEITPIPAEQEAILAREGIEELLHKDDIKKRQQDIVNIVSTWSNLHGTEIKITDVCQKPVTRANIAHTFGDLLVLAKSGFVELISEEQSLELRCIRRGRKLLQRT